jgi:sugar/nucleoside kinase (ribokinase family)
MAGVALQSAESKLTTLALGHVTHDRVEGRLVPGGCAYYAAKTWEALGARSRLHSVIGEDFACQADLEGLECQLARSGLTTTFTNIYPSGATRIQYVEAMAPPIDAGQLPPDWRAPDVAFLGPVIGELDIDSLREVLRPRVLAIGVQGFVRTSIAEPPALREARTDLVDKARRVVPRPWLPPLETLRGIDVACLSVEDLEGQPGLLERLVAVIPLVALTRDRAGCDLIRPGRPNSWVGIHPAQVVDPTGAGDTFAAGLLFGMAQGLEAVAAARLGAAAASIIIEGIGGEAFSRLDEAFQRAQRID